jgi:hypothetical protein
MRLLRIFVASPSDLRPERQIVNRVLAELNSAPEYRLDVKFVPFLYEDSAPAVVGVEPQAVVDDFMLRAEDANIVICMFWNRLGTPLDAVDPETGHAYESGTAYELLKSYRHFRQHGAPIVLLYRCVREANLDEAGRHEASRVDAFFERFSAAGDLRGLVGQFTHADDFAWTLRTHLLHAIEHNERRDRRMRLRAMFADHHAFIGDRLSRCVGRHTELREINRLIAERMERGGYITVTGQAGQGKSTVIAKLVDEAGIEAVAHHFIPINPGPDHQVSLLRNLMARLIDKYELPDVYLASDSRPLLRDFFPKVLGEVSERGGREVIYIDGLDQLQEEPGGERDLSFLPRRLPPGIVCVLGTRPNDALRPLELLDPHYEYPLPHLSRVDFLAILARRGAQLDESTAERFYRAMDANALYLDLVARELADAEHIEPDTIIRRLAADPDNIFSLSMDRLRRQRVLWDGAIKPLLGLLLVSQRPLHDRTIRYLLRVDADTLRSALEKLGGLIASDAIGGRHLFHLKFIDYLRPADRDESRVHLFDSEEVRSWHGRLADWCESGSGDLTDIWIDTEDAAEQARRMYAREHYATHLFSSERLARLIALLNRGEFGKAKLHYDPSTRSYGRDLSLGCEALLRTASSDEERARSLPSVWRYSLLRCSLATKARNYADELFTLLVLTGRSSEALELVDLMPTAERRITALCRIAQALIQGADRRLAETILVRAEQLAESLRDIWSHSHAFRLLLRVTLAGRDWDESVRVAFRLGDARERVDALGAVIQAVAAAGDSDRMVVLIGKYFDLARQIGYRGRQEGALQAVLAHDGGQFASAAATQHPRVTPATDDSHSFAASVLIGRGDIDGATAITHRIRDPYLELTTLIDLARHGLRAAKHTTTRPIIDTLPEICTRISDATWRTEGTISLSLLMAEAGNRSGAIEFLAAASRGRMSGSHVAVLDDLPARVSAVAALAEDVAAVGNGDSALAIVEEAVTMTRDSANLEHRKACLKDIADVAARTGRDELAGDLLVEAGGAPLALYGDIDAVLEALYSIGNVKGAIDLLVSDRYLDSLLEKQNWDGAIEFARSRTSKKTTYDKTLGNTATAPAAPLSPAPAASDHEHQRYLQKRVSRSLVVARALLDARDMSRARAIVDEVLPLLPTIQGSSIRAPATARCADVLARLDEVGTAVVLMQDALGMSQRLVFADKLDVLIALLPTALDTRQVGLATSIVDKLTDAAADTQDHSAKTLALRYVVRALARVKSASRLHELVYAEWTRMQTRDEIVAVLPLASALVAEDSSAGKFLVGSFEWVDEFLAVA